MKKCKNKKGTSLVEVLIYLALISIFTPMIMSVFVDGFESYKTNNNLIEQEKKVSSVIQKIRNEVERCDRVETSLNFKELSLTFSDGTVNVWKFENGGLKKDPDVVVENIDDAKSKFYFVGTGVSKRLVVEVQPKITNNLTKYKNRNILKPIITEFSVKYKN